MSPPLPISILHYVMCTFGTTVNVALLGIIVVRTPANLTCYAILLFSQTLLQASTCFTSEIIFVRLIPKDHSLFLVISGPANMLGSGQLGFYLWSIMLHGHAHYCIMLAVCFSYRYYVIRYPSPNFRTIVFLVLFIYLPTLIIHSWLSQTPLFDQETSKMLLTSRGPSYIFEEDEVFVGIPNVLEPAVLTALAWVIGVCVPSYTIILIVGRLMYRTLAANISHMSERTRASHKEIVRGLVFQAFLPALYSFSCGTYLVGQLSILNLEALEYGTHMAGELIVTASPLMTLYFVQPYRRTVRQ